MSLRHERSSVQLRYFRKVTSRSSLVNGNNDGNKVKPRHIGEQRLMDIPANIGKI